MRPTSPKHAIMNPATIILSPPHTSRQLPVFFSGAAAVIGFFFMPRRHRQIKQARKALPDNVCRGNPISTCFSSPAAPLSQNVQQRSCLSISTGLHRQRVRSQRSL